MDVLKINDDDDDDERCCAFHLENEIDIRENMRNVIGNDFNWHNL